MFIGEAKKLIVVVIGALLNAIGLNLFLIPADVYASGFTGVAQLLSSLIDQYAPFYVSTGILLFILNIPVGILGWMKVGRSFTLYSIISVALTTIFLGVLPETSVSQDILLNAVFGGVISAVGIGITLKIRGIDRRSRHRCYGVSKMERQTSWHVFLYFKWNHHFYSRIITRLGESIIYPCHIICDHKGH